MTAEWWGSFTTPLRAFRTLYSRRRMHAAAVLYLAPVPESLEELEVSVDRSSWLDVQPDGEVRMWTGVGEDLRFEACTDPLEAAARTRARHYALAVVDCRQVEAVSAEQAAAQEKALHAFLDRVRDERDPDRRFPFERIAVLVGGRDLERSDRKREYDRAQRETAGDPQIEVSAGHVE